MADANKLMGGKGAGPPPDYTGAANQQFQLGAQYNRPNISTPFGSEQWATGPDGKPQLQTGFSGGLGQAASSLGQQAGQALSSPLSFGGLSPLTTGADARNQAITGAYNQATSRLDPRFAQGQEQLNAQLANQGLDPNSQAARTAQLQFGQQRNDAYTSAMNGAIGQGTQAGQALFGDSLLGRQQGANELMAQRNAPLQGLAQMQGLLSMPNFTNVGAPNLLGAAQAQGNYQLGQAQQNSQIAGDIGAGLGGLGSFFAFSDERLKQNIVRLDAEAIPGVPWATWEFKASPGARHFGVIAQDLEKVSPEYVRSGSNGIKMVDYSFVNKVKRG